MSNSQHSYFPVTCGNFIWTAESQPHESVRQRPNILVHVPTLQPINRKIPASKNNTNFCSGSEEEPRIPVWITYKAWCEKQFKWPEVTGNYQYTPAFQVLAACEAHLGNNHFILLNGHGQLSWLSAAIREEKTVSVGRDYNNISFHSATDNEGPAEQNKTEEIRVSTLHSWQNSSTYLEYEVVSLPFSSSFDLSWHLQLLSLHGLFFPLMCLSSLAFYLARNNSIK